MEPLKLLAAALLFVTVNGVSNGNLPVCDVDMAIGAGTNVMKWVQPPVASSQYTITASGQGSYRPGALTPITITVQDIAYIYIGLLLVAEGAGPNNTKYNAGQWTVMDGDDFFLPATCKFAAVAHKNANLKGITQTFYWQGVAGTGPVTFRALIKQGEQNHGNFYKPADLTLTEGTPIASQAVWRSAPGASCDDTCAKQNLACDQTNTLKLSTAASLQAAVQDYYPCRKPLLRACAPPATGANSHCFFSNCTADKTFASLSTCSRKSSDPIMNQQFCACKAGTPVPDAKPPVGSTSTFYGLRLAAPLQLDTELTLNDLEISQDGVVTIDVSGPQDRWFAIGWNASYMKGAYATVVWLNDPSIAPPPDWQVIGDQGYQDGLNGWYDAKCQGALNDYCRNVGYPTIWFSCALANHTWWDQGTDAGVFNSNLTSRVPCKSGKVAPYRPMTVAEYILNDNPRGAALLPSTITPIRSLVDGGRFHIVFSRNVSGVHPFPNQTSIPIIWSMGVQQYFGAPFDTQSGAAQQIKHAKKSDSGVTVSLLPIYPVCLSSSVTTLPSMLLLAGLVGLGSKNWVLGALLAILVHPAAAHNWVNTPSRALIAAVTVPCQERVDPAPHLQVGPGQTFQLEWSTGHGDTPTAWTYWVFLKEADYNFLVDLTDSMLDDYLAKAPPSSLLVGDQWTRKHLSPYDNYKKGCVNCNNGSLIPGTFQTLLTPGDARYTTRNPVAVEKSLQWWDQNVTQFWYPSAQTSGDMRAQYNSEKYPWIISAHKFRVPNHWPSEYDIATFSFPNVADSGNYVAHYKWGGYRDCTDVNVVNIPTTTFPWGQVEGGNVTSTFTRIEHCEWTFVLNPSTPCQVMKTPNASACLNACLDDEFGCRGVQAVLKTNPAGTMPYTPNYPYKQYTRVDAAFAVFPPSEEGPCDSRTIQKRSSCPDKSTMCGDTQLSGALDTDYICYGLTPYRDQDFQTVDDYVVSTDPRDPGFYSTCWVRLAPGGFLPYPLPIKPPPVWRVGEQCISCDWLAKTFPKYSDNSAPVWVSALTADCADCDLQAATECNADSSFIDGGHLGSCANSIPNGGVCSSTCGNGFTLFGAARVCENGILTGREQQCTFTGC